MELVHCIYTSAATMTNFRISELDALLEKARINNANLGITGMLLYEDGSFFQVLEGGRTDVEALFEKIAKDKRHKNAKKVIFEPIEERAFAEWTMGYPRITFKELAEIPGLNDFFGQGTSLREIGEGRAKALLAAFKEGKWRSSLR